MSQNTLKVHDLNEDLDAITNGQWYLLKAISLPIMQGGLICYDRILCLNIYPQNTK